MNHTWVSVNTDFMGSIAVDETFVFNATAGKANQ